jgi:hypothetical protein
LKAGLIQIFLPVMVAGCSFLPSLSPATTPLQSQAAKAKQAQADLLDQPQKWPHLLNSKRYPLTVRYLLPGDKSQAERVMGYLEKSWQVEIEQMGFPPPIPSDSTGSKRLQVYLMRGADTAVEATRPNKNKDIWWDAWESYLSIDAWGPYGGEILDSTTAHEFNHALHAALDWYESPGFFETSATFIQDKVYPEDNDYLQQIEDFQSRPEWPVHHFDNYKTWYPYGACLYLFFLEQRYFAKQPHFLAQIWKNSRNTPRPFDPKTGYPSPISNEPDWVDALEGLLPRGVDYAQTVVEFARWRWYSGRHSDGKHFHEGALLSPKAEVKIQTTLLPGQTYRSQGPLPLGSEYLRLKRPATGQGQKLQIKLQAEGRFALQLVPGLSPNSDGEMLGPSGLVEFGNLPERTLILTALPPADRPVDPDLPAGKTQSFQILSTLAP